MESLNIETVVS